MTTQPPLDDEQREDLVAYLDGELDEETARALEAKLSLDPAVRVEADQLRRTWELLDYLPKAEPSPTFTHRTLDRVSALRPTKSQPVPGARRRPWLIGLGWAAAVLLAGTVGYTGVNLVYPPDRTDEELARDLRVIEYKRLYDVVDDFDFLRELDTPDLFGDEGTGG
jgi:ferric-dicitrate binding protein FerR (iron transport regulator)